MSKRRKPDLLGSEFLFYGGIALMAVTAMAAIISVIVFRISGKKIKDALEGEYGKPER